MDRPIVLTLARFGFFYVLPLTAPQVISRPSGNIPPTTITSDDDLCTVTFGDYNVHVFSTYLFQN